MAYNHDMPTAGHLVSRESVARVSDRYHWPGMHRDVRNYMRNCESCKKYKHSQCRLPGKY